MTEAQYAECFKCVEYFQNAELKRENLASPSQMIIVSRHYKSLKRTDQYPLMWSELEQGRRPVPDLTNLGHYHEIALRAGAGDKRDDDYLPAYAEAMARRHLTSPLPADPRAWPGR